MENEQKVRGTNRLLTAGIAVCALLLATGTSYTYMVWMGIGFNNAATPPGYMGYVTQGSIIGSKKYIGVQAGPASTGAKWLYDVQNISITPYTFEENFEGQEGVQASDSTLIEFSVNAKLRVRPTEQGVKGFVEGYASRYPGQDPDKIVKIAYNNFCRQPLRAAARQQIEAVGPLAIKDNMGSIGKTLHEYMVNLTKDTPFEVTDVSFGFLHYPESVTNRVAQAIASTERLKQRDIEIKIVEEERKIKVTEAEAISTAMEIIRQNLTPEYLQWEAVQVQAATIDSKNPTTLIIPVGPLGVPLTDPTLTKKVATPAPVIPKAAESDTSKPAEQAVTPATGNGDKK